MGWARLQHRGVTGGLLDKGRKGPLRPHPQTTRTPHVHRHLLTLTHAIPTHALGSLAHGDVLQQQPGRGAVSGGRASPSRVKGQEGPGFLTQPLGSAASSQPQMGVFRVGFEPMFRSPPVLLPRRGPAASNFWGYGLQPRTRKSG